MVSPSIRSINSSIPSGDWQLLIFLFFAAIVTAHALVLPKLFQELPRSTTRLLLLSITGLAAICCVLFVAPTLVPRAVLGYSLLFLTFGFYVTRQLPDPSRLRHRFVLGCVGIFFVVFLFHARGRLIS